MSNQSISPVPPPLSLVLVAIMPSPRDMEIARLLGWYRIPLRTAPKVISVDYLAFYQPSSFADQGLRIQYTAPVVGHELTTRAELLRVEQNHPRSQEEYFKILIGPLTPLHRPIIASRWKRITFFYTTGERLEAAVTISDLVVPAEERLLLWRALRERAGRSNRYHTPNLKELEQGVGGLEILLGIQDLVSGKG